MKLTQIKQPNSSSALAMATAIGSIAAVLTIPADHSMPSTPNPKGAQPVAAEPMPTNWGYEGGVAGGADKVLDYTLSANLTTSVAVGQLLVAYCVTRDTTDHAITDSEGHNWTNLSQNTWDGQTASIWILEVTDAMTTADSITLTTETSENRKVLSVLELRSTAPV